MGTWNYVVNSQFVEQYGEGAAAKFAAVLGDVAARLRAGDREHALGVIDEAFDGAGFNMPKAVRDMFAENMTLAEHDRIVISDEFGHVIAEHALPGDRGAAGEDNRPLVEPEDNSRPTYS